MRLNYFHQHHHQQLPSSQLLLLQADKSMLLNHKKLQQYHLMRIQQLMGTNPLDTHIQLAEHSMFQLSIHQKGN
jgi:hypothetical protein